MFSGTASEFNRHLANLLGRDRAAVADFIVALAEFDARKLWEELGYTSLFMYLNRELGLSKAAAYYRKTATDLVREYPGLLQPLRDGRLCMTALAELAKVVTTDNSADVIPQFFNCSKVEAREVAAALAPMADPPRREVVTPIFPKGVVRPDEPLSPVRMGSASRGEGPPAGPEGPCAAPPAASHAPPASAPQDAALTTRPPAPYRDDIEPLTGTLFRYHLTVSREFLQKLDAARSALSHSKPNASACEILKAGLELLIAEDGRRKGMVGKPRAAPRPSTTDHIPAHVRRAVWARDGGCCQWTLPSGELCGSRTRLQFDHIVPRALGGPSTIENVRVLCAAHNRLAARRVLGDACMDRFLRRPRALAAAGGGAAVEARRPSRPRRVERRRTGEGPGGG